MVTIDYRDISPENIATKTDFLTAVTQFMPDGIRTLQGIICRCELTNAFYAYDKAKEAADGTSATEERDAERPWVRKVDSSAATMARAKAEAAWNEYAQAVCGWAEKCRELWADARAKRVTSEQTDAIRAVWRAMGGMHISPAVAGSALQAALDLTRGNYQARKELEAALVDRGVERSAAASTCETLNVDPGVEVAGIYQIIETDGANRQQHWDILDNSSRVARHVEAVARWA